MKRNVFLISLFVAPLLAGCKFGNLDDLCSISFECDHCRIVDKDGKDAPSIIASKGEKFTFTAKADGKIYDPPEEVYFINDSGGEYSGEHSYDYPTGKIQITLTENVKIIANGDPVEYQVDFFQEDGYTSVFSRQISVLDHIFDSPDWYGNEGTWYCDELDMSVPPGGSVNIPEDKINTYSFVWNGEYRIVFYEDMTEFDYRIITTFDREFTAPDHAGAGVWHNDDLQMDVAPGASAEIPEDKIADYEFYWAPDSQLNN